LVARSEREAQLQRTRREAELAERERSDAALRKLNAELASRNSELGRSNEALRGAVKQAEAAVEARSRFMAAITHELRTPLNGILGMAQLIALNPLDPEQQEQIGFLQSSGNHLLGLIDRILTFARLNEGEQEAVELRRMPIQPLLDEVWRMVSSNPEAHSLKLLTRWDADAPKEAVADPEAVRRILLNLLGNAMRYTDSGQIEIRVSRSLTGLRLSVTDTGTGIDPADHEKIFDAFAQSG
jgi:signal transduction histidine kinase